MTESPQPADSPVRRDSAAPLHRGARRPDRAALAGPLERGRHVQRAQSGRSALLARSVFPPTSCSFRTCSRTPRVSGLHVGHPLGYIATDVFARFIACRPQRAAHPRLRRVRSAGRAVRRAEGTHRGPRPPRPNIGNMKRQLRRLGLGHDERASSRRRTWTSTTGRSGSSCRSRRVVDKEAGKARRISELEAEFVGERAVETDGTGSRCPRRTRKRSSTRTASRTTPYSMVNWCPGLGTVLANEEVTSDGRSDAATSPCSASTCSSGSCASPVLCTVWSTTEIPGLAGQGQDHAAQLDRPLVWSRAGAVRGATVTITHRACHDAPDTLFGATYVTLAPEHDLVDELVAEEWPAGVDARWTVAPPARRSRSRRTVSRSLPRRTPTSGIQGEDRRLPVPTRSNPVNGHTVPVFIADYV